MEYIRVTEENLEKEHICCAISNNNDCQVASKKGWLKGRFAEGLVFLKSVERGKCFIEYIPAENAFAPVCAPGYMYIDCLWVSGQFKGHGYSNDLLDECIRDSKAKGMAGVVALSSEKKQGFLADPKFLEHKGFSVCDSANPYFTLMYLPFSENAEKPRFSESARNPHIDESGFVIYYDNQCPYTAKYVPLLAEAAEKRCVKFRSVLLETAKQAQNAPSPFTAFTLFYNGEFVTHEILSVPKFEKIIDSKA